MLATSFNFGGTIGEIDVFMLNDEPDWQQSVKTSWEILSGLSVSLSQREGRRPHSATLRCSMQYQTTRTGADARQLIGALRDYATQPVFCPLWPATVTWAEFQAETHPAESWMCLVWKPDWSRWRIFTEFLGGPTDEDWITEDDYIAPLMWGRLAKREPAWLSNDTLAFDVQFDEQGPAKLDVQPAPASFADGPMPPAGYSAAPKLLPFRANFAGVQDALNLQLLREQIGFTRDAAETLYAQAIRRETKVPFLLTSQAAAFQVLRFFMDVAAPGAAFWAPGWMTAALLSGDVSAGDQTLNVADTASLRVGDYVALLSGETTVPALVDVVTAGTIHLTSAPGAFAARDTIVTPLLLVRLDKPQLDIEFLAPNAARVALQLHEVPPEYSPPSDETIGGTLGRLPTRAWLYEFSRVLDSETHCNRYTSYESDLVYDGNKYTSARIDHGEIKGSLALESDEVTIKADSWGGNPLLLLPQLKLESPLKIVIRQGEVDGIAAINTAVLFTGEVVGVKVKGSRLQAKCTALGSVFDRKFPRFFIQPQCNHTLFDPGCGLLSADWKFTATIYDPGAAGYPFSLVLRDLARVVGSLPAPIFADWFAGGWIETGAGLDWQRRPILASTAYVGSPASMTIQLDRDLDPIPTAGQAVALWPGCDLTPETCKAYNALSNLRGKFDNYLNYGGHPFVPTANPSLVKLAQSTDGGKK